MKLFTIDMDESKLPWPEIEMPEIPAGQIGRWQVFYAELPMLRGYFRALREVGSYPVLLEGTEPWMSFTPREAEAMQHHVAVAKGHVVMVGAGLGIAAYNMLKKPEVTELTLIEINKTVHELLWKIGIWDWPGAKEKMTMVRKDVFKIGQLDKHVDFLYVDIWKDLGEEEALSDVKKIFEKFAEIDLVGWWGQEIDFICWLLAQEYKPPPTDEQYTEWVEWTGLPVLHVPDHAYWSWVAARNLHDS